MSGAEAASCLFEGEIGVQIPRRMRVFARELISEEVIPADEGVEGGRGMRGVGGRRPRALRRLGGVSKNLKDLQPKSSAVLAHPEAAGRLPVAQLLDLAPWRLEEAQTLPLELELQDEMSS